MPSGIGDLYSLPIVLSSCSFQAASRRLASVNRSRPLPAITFDEPLHFYDIEGSGCFLYAVGERRLAITRLGRIYQLAPIVRDITPLSPSPEEYYYRTCYAQPGGGLWVAAAPYAAFSSESYKILHWDGEQWLEAGVDNDTGATARFFDIEFLGGEGWAVGGTTFAQYRR